MKIQGATINTPLARTAVVKDDIVSGKPWSSQNTIDKLCPTFTESGAVAVCEPVEGYPLTVEASEEATKVVRCGKNIFDIATAGVYHSNAAGDPYFGMRVTENGFYIELLQPITNSWSRFGFWLGTTTRLFTRRSQSPHRWLFRRFSRCD